MATLAQWKEQIKADNPSLTKMVDGVKVDLTTTEYNKTIDEWARASRNQEIATNIKDNGGLLTTLSTVLRLTPALATS
jgi:hypothetical protein